MQCIVKQDKNGRHYLSFEMTDFQMFLNLARHYKLRGACSKSLRVRKKVAAKATIRALEEQLERIKNEKK